MKIVVAMVALRDGHAAGIYRADWAPSASIIKDADGTHLLLQTHNGRTPWMPHSIDAAAEDWEIIRATHTITVDPPSHRDPA